MIVIIEGIDRVGKTTLCEKLKEKGFVILKDSLDYFVEHEHLSKDTASISLGKIDTTFRFACQLDLQGVNVAIDRCHLTEIVYGSCERKSCEPEAIRFLEESFFVYGDVINALLVLVEPTNILEACARADKDLRKHNDKFKKLFAVSTMDKIRTNFNELDSAVNYIIKSANSDVDYDFYLASPFFRPDQVEREERVKGHLRNLGYRVFSPKEACFLSPDAQVDVQKSVFDGNCEAIKRSTAVFAITDTKDMGTIWEAGYAYGINKPVVYFAETLGDNPFNLMLAQSGVAVFTQMEELNRDNLDDLSHVVSYGGLIE